MVSGIDNSLQTLAKGGASLGLFGGSAAQEAAKSANENQKFQNLLERLQNEQKKSVPNVENPVVSAQATPQKIDKSSKLYEQTLELETFFVKIMLSSMRNTISKSGLNGSDSHAQKIYEDMLYDELASSLTKNAGFGLADQMYTQLVHVSA